MFYAPFLCLIKHCYFKRELDLEDEKGNGGEKDAISQRLEEIYKRLQLIDADSVESRAAAILAVSSVFTC